jgi:hypothetical protein
VENPYGIYELSQRGSWKQNQRTNIYNTIGTFYRPVSLSHKSPDFQFKNSLFMLMLIGKREEWNSWEILLTL